MIPKKKVCNKHIIVLVYVLSGPRFIKNLKSDSNHKPISGASQKIIIL